MTIQHELAVMIRKKFNSGEAKLPLLPEAVIKVQRIAKDESKGAADIAKAIGDDPTFSTTVMRLANSAQFNPRGHDIRSLQVAVQRLGGRKVLQLMIALSAKVHIKVKNRDLQEILRRSAEHSLMVACAAQHLAKLIGSADPDEAFLAGMVHDIGIAAVISAAEKELSEIDHESQLDAICTLHREMGGRLLSYWNMPDVFSTLASHHGIESDDRPNERLIDYVDAADFLIQRGGHSVMFDSLAEGIEVSLYPPMSRLGATEIHVAAVEVELEDSIKEMQQAIG
ncbi:MAG: HDOD domain-containing protein [Mariprofundaceae bacterium]|nr:HDOD domain-containing protein [Mariprofundaceae bacterium]